MRKHAVTILTMLLALVAGTAQAAPGRDYLIIVGSTTIYPFSEMVVERFVEDTGFETPMVQALGSGGGLMLFCNGLDELDPDIAYASRPIRKSEIARCRENGVGDIVEVKIGYDGIILAQSRKTEAFSLTRQDVYLALAKHVPDPDAEGGFVENPHETWRDVREDLPAVPIEVWGPGRASGTLYMFRRLAMEEGCRTLEGVIELEEEDPWRYREVCRDIRDDGKYTEVSEDDERTVAMLSGDAGALALLSFGVVESGVDTLRGLSLDGIAPDLESIANGSYLLARPLYLYVKKANADVYPGLREFLAEFTSDEAWGSGGYLRARGLIPMATEERSRYTEIAKHLTPM